jgi:hypothetical protein
MARPRIFVSSTFYDLRQVRADLERFIRDLGFEPVLHERGNIPYGHEERLENYCYREVGTCDILVSIVGSRFGSHSGHADYSISQMELKKAIELQKPVYIFVEHAVFSELRTYLANTDNSNVRYTSVDDSRIFQFIDEVRRLPHNNLIFTFSTVVEITDVLREQWAGLFRNLLNESLKQQEVNLSKELKGSLSTLRQMIDHIASDRSRRDEVISTIVTLNHPLFSQIADVTSTTYRVIFNNLEEMGRWLTSRGWVRQEDETDWDDSVWLVWTRDWGKGRARKLRIMQHIFSEDNKLKHFDHNEWQSEWLEFEDIEKKQNDDANDEIPF